MLLKCTVILFVLAAPYLSINLTEDEEAVADPGYESPYASAPKAQSERLTPKEGQTISPIRTAAPPVTTTIPSLPKMEEQLVERSQEGKNFWDSLFGHVHDMIDYVAEEGLFNMVYKKWRLVVIVSIYSLIIITVGIAMFYCFLKHADDEDLSMTSVSDQSDDDLEDSSSNNNDIGESSA